MNIVLTENLNLAGGMIALAERGPDGLPAEAGNLQIKATSIIASTLHDLDNCIVCRDLVRKNKFYESKIDFLQTV